MTRSVMLRALPVVLLIAGPAAAQPAKDPPKETVIRLTVDPAAAPRPALKYLFLPHQFELRPGNGVLQVYKCQMERAAFYYDKEEIAKRERYLVCPLDELPSKELLNYGDVAIRWADYAARHEHWDWAITDKIKTDGISTLLPDLQTIRDVAKTIDLPVTFLGAGKDPWGNEKVAFEAEIRLNRKDFGLTWNAALETGGFLVGEDVDVSLNVQAARS